jgi:hypothetical protein
MSGKNYIPAKNEDFNSWLTHFVSYVSGKCTTQPPAWGHIPTDKVVELNAQADAWNTAWQEAIDTPTAAKRHERDRVRGVVEAFVRGFINDYLHRDPVTDMERDEVGVPNRGGHHGPKPDPTDHVAFTLRFDVKDHSLWADYRIEGSTSRSKGGYHGVEVRRWMLPLDAPAPESANHPGWVSEVDTGTPWGHTFTEAEIGMRAHIAMRWENSSVGKGKNKNEDSGKGPWSSFQSAVIA